MSESSERHAEISKQLASLAKELESVATEDANGIIQRLQNSGLTPDSLERLAKLTAKAGGLRLLRGDVMAYHY